MEYKKVFKPIEIGRKRAKNRIEVSPAEPFLCTRDGEITDEFIAFTQSFARGGAGIVTVGDSPVTQEYADKNKYVVNLSDPYIVHGLYKVTEAIHRYGALASIELNLRLEVFPSEMTKAEIKEIIRSFAQSAEYCKKGGFDIVMIHGGHGHTVAQFYSPQMNKRTDEYGAQNFENRCRFANELIDAVRESAGEEMAIDYRLSGDELTPGGVGLEEALAFAREIEKKLDIIHISAGNMYEPESIKYTIQPTYLPQATNEHIAARFKRELKIPVTAVGSYNMELAERALRDGKADVIAMIRQFIAEPDCVNKARRGELIRPCIRCCVCTGDDPHGCPKPLRCAVNPVSGRNAQFEKIGKSGIGKKVAVIGGGCGGLEAARRLSERGHSVVLIEKDTELGGSLRAAGANRLKGDIKRYCEWSVKSAESAENVEIRLGEKATRELITQLKPDAVIVAAGSEPYKPEIPGIENAYPASEIDLGLVIPGARVVLIGAGLTGTETAVTLAQDGHDVTLIDMLTIEEIDAKSGASRSVKALLRKLMRESGVKVRTGLRLKRITKESVIAEDKDGNEEKFACDTAILSIGVRPAAGIREEFEKSAEKVVYIGDCTRRGDGNIQSAVLDGFYAAIDI